MFMQDDTSAFRKLANIESHIISLFLIYFLFLYLELNYVVSQLSTMTIVLIHSRFIYNKYKKLIKKIKIAVKYIEIVRTI